VWCDLGREMKAAKEQAGPLAHQAGEREYYKRYLAMSGTDRGKREFYRTACARG
jgi:hypothetical protein